MENIKLQLDNITTADQKTPLINKLVPGRSRQFRGPVLLITVLCCAICIAFLTANAGVAGGALFVIALTALPVVYILIAYPRPGIVFLLVFAYLFFTVSKFVSNFPMGTLIDGLEVLLITGLLLQQKRENNWQLFKGPVSLMILIWITYNLLEVLNPAAESKLAWVYTVRSVAMVMLTYFIFINGIRTLSFIRTLLKIWIGLSVMAALYGLKQEFIGFSASEEAFLYSDPIIASLLFINGHWRIFSIFSDPVAFSYNMVISSLLCLCLITGPFENWKKIVLGSLSALFLFSMLYSGTRGAYVLVPVGLALFAVLKYSKKILIISVVAALLIGVVIIIPTSNPTLYRLQSAFKPSEDASYILRKQNQKKIQPYILSHPMGGGLGATGVWGTRFAPNSYLANFPPDSGYVRIAVELGWIGLFLFCVLVFTILKTGIRNYYRIRNPELKSYCLAMTLIVFVLHVGNYPQEAIVQFPTNILFYFTVALITITYRIDKEISVKKIPDHKGGV